MRNWVLLLTVALFPRAPLPADHERNLTATSPDMFRIRQAPRSRKLTSLSPILPPVKSRHSPLIQEATSDSFTSHQAATRSPSRLKDSMLRLSQSLFARKKHSTCRCNSQLAACQKKSKSPPNYRP